MEHTELLEKLKSLADPAYREFQKSLIPMDHPFEMIGIRTPELREIASQMYKEGEYQIFLSSLPHGTFEENQLHAFIVSLIRDMNVCLKETDRFLPYVDNWATCDQLRPKVFAKNRDQLRVKINEWIASDHTYTVRFGIGMLMCHFLDDDFSPDDYEAVAGIESDEYYINMMRAWYFATALAKQYNSAVKILEQNRLDPWTHNKTIQKARESFRVSEDKKEYMKKLKR